MTGIREVFGGMTLHNNMHLGLTNKLFFIRMLIWLR